MQDVQTLIGLLNGLMPLLQRAQSAAHGQASWPPHLLAMNPVLDHRAGVTLVENIIADQLSVLTAYIEANAAQVPVLENGKTSVAKAEHCRALGDYAQAFDLVFDCYRAITQLRAANPQLPALQAQAGKEMPFKKMAPAPTAASAH
jgi:hypothetical protein